MKLFMKRHPQISFRRVVLKKPACPRLLHSILPVSAFIERLGRVLNKDSFTADIIYNADETGLTTMTDY